MPCSVLAHDAWIYGCGGARRRPWRRVQWRGRWGVDADFSHDDSVHPSTGGGTPTQGGKPAAPSNLSVTVNGGTRVFTWSSVSNVQDYFIQIGTSGSENPDLINTNTSQTTYTWTGAGPGNYWARVYARNSAGSSPNSDTITFH